MGVGWGGGGGGGGGGGWQKKQFELIATQYREQVTFNYDVYMLTSCLITTTCNIWGGSLKAWAEIWGESFSILPLDTALLKLVPSLICFPSEYPSATSSTTCSTNMALHTLLHSFSCLSVIDGSVEFLCYISCTAVSYLVPPYIPQSS